MVLILGMIFAFGNIAFATMFEHRVVTMKREGGHILIAPSDGTRTYLAVQTRGGPDLYCRYDGQLVTKTKESLLIPKDHHIVIPDPTIEVWCFMSSEGWFLVTEGH